MTQVFILACGRYSRHLEKAGDRTRLNLTFGGVTLIERIVKKARQHGHEPLVVTDDKAVEKTLLPHEVDIFRPSKSCSCVETILSTKPFWDSHNVFLMGDVAYNHGSYLTSFKDYKGECRVIGTHLEPYTLTFGKTDEARVEKVLKKALEMTKLPKQPKHKRCIRTGKLAIFYRLWCGIDPSENQFDNETYIMLSGVSDLDAWYDIPRVETILGVKAVRK